MIPNIFASTIKLKFATCYSCQKLITSNQDRHKLICIGNTNNNGKNHVIKLMLHLWQFKHHSSYNGMFIFSTMNVSTNSTRRIIY